MSGADRVSRAEARVRDARGRLERTLGALQRRLNPSRMARDVWHDAKEKSVEIAQDAVGVARRRPATVGLVAAGIAAFFARNRIANAARKLFKQDEAPAARPRRRSRRPKS